MPQPETTTSDEEPHKPSNWWASRARELHDRTNSMSATEAANFADRLMRRGTPLDAPSLAGQVSELEMRCYTAGLLIRAMLRQVHSSDVFRLD
jgi:hypothetical protein